MNSIIASGRSELEYTLEQKIRAELEKRYDLKATRGLERLQLVMQINLECQELLKKAMPSVQAVF